MATMKVIARGKLDLITLDGDEYYIVGGKSLGTILDPLVGQTLVISLEEPGQESLEEKLLSKMYPMFQPA